MDSTPKTFRRRRIAFHLATKVSTGRIVNSSSNAKAALNPHDAFGAGIEATAATSNTSRVLCAESAIIRSLNWTSIPRPVDRCFRNIDNTCFLTATLQCLAYVPPVAQLLLPSAGANTWIESVWGGAGETRKSGQGVVNVLDMLRDVFSRLHRAFEGHLDYPSSFSTRTNSTNNNLISPDAFIANLPMFGRQFRRGRQEDAHEFFMHLIAKLQSHCLQSAKLFDAVSTESDRYLTETTAVHRLFGGQILSHLKCGECGASRRKTESFFDISLPIDSREFFLKKRKRKKKDGVNCTIEDAIKNFTAPERLENGERWMCPHCAKLVRTEKRLSFLRAPNTCVLHLKRFLCSPEGNVQKLGHHVAFSEIMSLPILVGEKEGAEGEEMPESQVSFRLSSVLIHAGPSMHSGHYISFVRSNAGAWYRVDGEAISMVKRATVLDQSAYMLFYTRYDPNAPPPSKDTTEKKIGASRATEKDCNPSQASEPTTAMNATATAMLAKREQEIVHSGEMAAIDSIANRRSLDPKRGVVVDVSVNIPTDLLIAGNSRRTESTSRLGSSAEVGLESWNADEATKVLPKKQKKHRSYNDDVRQKHRYDAWDALLDKGKTKKTGKAARRAEAVEMARIDQERGFNPFQDAAQKRSQGHSYNYPRKSSKKTAKNGKSSNNKNI